MSKNKIVLGELPQYTSELVFDKVLARPNEVDLEQLKFISCNAIGKQTSNMHTCFELKNTESGSQYRVKYSIEKLSD